MCSLSRSLVVLAVLTASVAAAPDRSGDPGAITATLNFALGSMPVGGVDGFMAPGGHFDVGFRVRRWRLAAELETALWSIPHASDEPPALSGSFTRAGVALRWTLMEGRITRRDQRPASRFRSYVEAGVGRHRVDAPGVAVSRNDLMIGVGVAPEISLGPILFGANFGVRVLVSEGVTSGLARGACATCGPAAGHDLALLYVFGFTIGK